MAFLSTSVASGFSRKTSALAAALVLAATLASAQTTPATTAPADLDAYVARVMKSFDVPGISLAIVKSGKVVVAKGYGVRKLGDAAAVDAKTNFGIASNTKVMTATALGILVDEGKLKWETPVIDILPWFQMYDPFVTRELTIRDLLVHRSGLGLGAGDLLWWPSSTYNRREIATRLRYIKPATSFRNAYAYDNVLYLIAGEVIETISGQSWEDFITARILKKVGMTGTTVRHSDATKAGNIAVPHAAVDGKVRPIAPFDSDNTNPAGGVNANADDMAKWMMVVLARGKLPDGSRLIAEPTWRDITTGVTPVPIGTPAAELALQRPNFRAYGLGVNVQDYRGQKMLIHSGGLPGYVSRVMMFPDAELGISVLTNQESGEAFDAIAYRIADHFLGFAPYDWAAAYEKVAARQKASFAETEKRAVASRNATSKPSLPLAGYAGKYNDAWYGDITIEQQGDTLVMKFGHTPSLVGDLEHWQYDTFVVKWRDRELRADAYVTFSLTPDGAIDQAKMRAVSPATDFSYDFQDLLLTPVK